MALSLEAVKRNRARRRLRAAVAELLGTHAAPGHDYVLIARTETVQRPWPLLKGDLEHALRRLGLWRADVVSRYVTPSADLSEVLLSDDDEMRADAWEATALLLSQMSAAGIRHHDLNAKNVLFHLRSGAPSVAMLLDVDRVVVGEAPERALAGNFSRLSRSFRKWRTLYGARVDESEIDSLARRVREVTAAPSMTRS